MNEDILIKALLYYAKGCDTAYSLEAAERGDVDLADGTEAFCEDFGDVARKALKEYGYQDKSEDSD